MPTSPEQAPAKLVRKSASGEPEVLLCGEFGECAQLLANIAARVHDEDVWIETEDGCIAARVSPGPIAF